MKFSMKSYCVFKNICQANNWAIELKAEVWTRGRVF